MKNLLVGNFGAKNLGDELILSSALKDYPNSGVMTSDSNFSQKFVGKNFKTFKFPPTGFRSFLKYFFDGTYRKKNLELQKERFEKIIFPGGGLFAIKFRACFLWFLVFVFLKKKFPKSEFIFEYQGIDKNLSFLSKKIVQYIFSRVNYISVRDENSKKVLEVLGINNVELKDDRVFERFKDDKIIRRAIHNRPYGKRMKKQRILLLNSLSVFEQKKYSKLCEKYKNYRQIFVPFQPSDLAFVPENFKGKIIEVKTENQLLDLIGDSDSGVGERLHFLILCRCFLGSKNTKTLKKPYSEKVRIFCKKEDIKFF